MKKIVYILLPILSASIASCSLKEDIRSGSMPVSYYKDAMQCQTGLNGCYNVFKSMVDHNNYWYGTECQSDIIQQTASAQYDAYCDISSSSPRFGTTIWDNGYRGVSRVNSMLVAIDSAYAAKGINEEEYNYLYGEGVVLRAYFYYILTNTFGDVPFYEERVTGANNLEIAHLPRMSADDTRRKLVAELREWLLERKALPLMPTYSSENPKRYRMGAAVGLTLAGNMCMWLKEWAQARDFYEALEDIYGTGAGNPEGTLERYPLSDIPFRNKYTPESIWEVANEWQPYGIRITSTLASKCTPQRGTTNPDEEEADEEEDDHSDYYYEVGIPELGNLARTNSPARPTSHFYKDLMPYNSGDRRRSTYTANGPVQDGGGYLATGWMGYSKQDDRSKVAPHWLYFKGLKETSQPYLGDKFWCFGMIHTYDSNNFKLLRYASVVLHLAEVYLMQGDDAKACAYLNQIKRRAGIKEVQPADFVDAEALLEEIQNENARELFGEFQRKYELVRWGIWYRNVKEKGWGGSTLKNNVKPCHEYYPIADAQVTYSGGALDNKAYNEYGL